MTVARLVEEMPPDEFFGWRALARVRAEQVEPVQAPPPQSRPRATAQDIKSFMSRHFGRG